MAYKTKMQTEERNNATKKRQSERRNCLQKCFYSSKYVIDQASFPILEMK